jgi:hypothetical protein
MKSWRFFAVAVAVGWAHLLASSEIGAAKPTYFDGDPKDYQDLRYESPRSRNLTWEEQRELFQFLVDRVSFLRSIQSDADNLGEAIQRYRRDLESRNRSQNLSWAAGCAVVGAGCAIVSMEYLLAATGQSYASIGAGVTPGTLWTTLGLLGGGIGAALGYGVSHGKNSISPLRAQRRFHNLRLEEIMKAAEDVSIRIQAASIPLAFWTPNRLRFFHIHLAAFQALEILMRQDEVRMHQEIEEALEGLGFLKRSLKEEISDLSSSEVSAMTEAYRLRLRLLEEKTIQKIMERIENPPLPQYSSHLSSEQCLEILKGITPLDPKV